MLISSLQNPRVQQACRLRDNRGRKRQQRIIVDGLREIQRALDADLEIVEAYHCQSDDSATVSSLARRLEAKGCDLLTVTDRVFDKVSFGRRNEGLVAIAERPQRTLSDVTVSAEATVGVVSGLEKPGNLGAILRSADAAGLAAVFAVDSTIDVYHPNCIRASLGTVFHQQVVCAASEQVADWLRGESFQIVAALPGADQDFDRHEYAARTAIVLGSEAEGLTNTIWTSSGIQAVRIPMAGVADSLNVSVAAALLFYQARSRR